MQHEHAPRRSWRPLATIGALCLALILASIVIGQLRAALDPEARAAAEAERERQAVLNERLEPLDTFVAAGWRILPLLLVAGGGAVALLVAYRRWAAPEIVRAEKVIALQHAQSQRFPAHLHSLSFHDSSRQIAPEVAEVEERPGLAAPVPSFGELLQRGEIGKGKPLLLAYGEDGPISGSWLDLFSVAVGGIGGSGKTTTVRFLTCQAALHGARFLVLDWHEGHAESLGTTLQPLSSSFVCAPAKDERSAQSIVRMMEKELERRRAGKSELVPWILAVDEYTAWMRGGLADELSHLLERIATEARKYSLFALLSGQTWKADRSGGTEVRDALASSYCHHLKRNQARFILPAGEAAGAERLTTGAALLYRTTGEVLTVKVPNCTAADVRAVAGLLTSTQPTLETPWKANGKAVEMAEMPAGSAKPQTAIEARVLAAFDAGADISSIAREIYEATTGRKYQEATAEINHILREDMRRNRH